MVTFTVRLNAEQHVILECDGISPFAFTLDTHTHTHLLLKQHAGDALNRVRARAHVLCWFS